MEYRGYKIEQHGSCLNASIYYSFITKFGVTFSATQVKVLEELIDIYEDKTPS